MKINAGNPDKSNAVNHAANDRQPKVQAEPRIIVAAKSGDIDLLSSVIDDGVDINAKDSRGYTALMILADLGDIKGLNLLLEKGADVKVQSSNEAYTALMIAADNMDHYIKEFAVLSALIDANPSPEHLDHACDKGVTAFMLAVHSGNEKLAIKLKNSGADINKKNNDGFSALSYAAATGDAEKLLWLMGKKRWFSATHVREALDVSHSHIVKGILTDSLKSNPRNFIAESSRSAAPRQASTALPSVAIEHENSNMAMALAGNRGPEAAVDLVAPSPTAKKLLPPMEAGRQIATGALRPVGPVVRQLQPVGDDDQAQPEEKRSRPNSSRAESASGESGAL